MDDVSGLQVSQASVDTGHALVSGVSAATDIHHDDHVAVLADHEAVPVHSPPLVHQLSTWLASSEHIKVNFIIYSLHNLHFENCWEGNPVL